MDWLILVWVFFPLAIGILSFVVADWVSSRVSYFGGTVAVLIAFLPAPIVISDIMLHLFDNMARASENLPPEMTGGDGPAGVGLMIVLGIWLIYAFMVGSIAALIAFLRHQRREAALVYR